MKLIDNEVKLIDEKNPRKKIKLIGNSLGLNIDLKQEIKNGNKNSIFGHEAFTFECPAYGLGTGFLYSKLRHFKIEKSFSETFLITANLNEWLDYIKVVRTPVNHFVMSRLYYELISEDIDTLLRDKFCYSFVSNGNYFSTLKIKCSNSLISEFKNFKFFSISEDTLKNTDLEFISDEKNKDFLLQSEKQYKELLEAGVKIEEAKRILPNCLANTIFISASLNDWKKFFRDSTDNSTEMQNVKTLIKKELSLTEEELLNIEVDWGHD